VAISKTDAPAYTDIAGLSKLKRAAGNNDPAAIRTVAQQFESMFTRMMLKSMRDATGPDPMFGSDQEQMYQGMADDQLAIQLSKGKGFGLADMLVRQLQKMGVKGADAAANGTGSSAGAAATGGAAIAPRGTALNGAANDTSAAGVKAAAAYSATDRASATATSEASAMSIGASRYFSISARALATSGRRRSTTTSTSRSTIAHKPRCAGQPAASPSKYIASVNTGKASPAGAAKRRWTRGENGVGSGLTSITLAPRRRAVSIRPAAG